MLVLAYAKRLHTEISSHDKYPFLSHIVIIISIIKVVVTRVLLIQYRLIKLF